MTPQTHTRLLAPAAALLLLAVAPAASRATLITFDDGLVASGATLSNQYAGLGVTFAPGGGSIAGVVNPATTTQGFATNTNMGIGPVETGSGAGAPLSGRTLHTDSGWLAEDGDPVFTMTFTSAVSFLSLDIGANTSTQGVIFALNPATNTAIAVASSLADNLNYTLTATGIPAGARTFVIVPGNYNDYVGVDNINFTVVPEPSTWVMMAGGLGLLAVGQRFRRSARWA